MRARASFASEAEDVGRQKSGDVYLPAGVLGLPPPGCMTLSNSLPWVGVGRLSAYQCDKARPGHAKVPAVLVSLGLLFHH